MIIYANGCFDGFHSGHERLIKFCFDIASDDGRVIVGLNTDKSIKKLKGKDRPFYNYWVRETMIKEFVRWDYTRDVPKRLKDILYILPISRESDIIRHVRKFGVDYMVKGSDTLVDGKYSKITGEKFVKGVIFYQGGDMTIHSSNTSV